MFDLIGFCRVLENLPFLRASSVAIFFPGDLVRVFELLILFSCLCFALILYSLTIGSVFLVVFAGIVTRRPLVLQLHKTEGGQAEFAEFLHLPKRRFTDFCMFYVFFVSDLSARDLFS